MAATTKFQARHATLAYIATAVTWDVAALISGETFTGNVASVKNVTVTLPEQAVEQIALLGNTQQTIGANAKTVGTATGITPGYFQNQALSATSIDNWKMEGTLVLTGDEQFIDTLGLGTSQAITGGTRYAVGDLTSAGKWSQAAGNQLGSVRIFLDNSSEAVTIGMSNIWVVGLGDIKPTGSDGHFEQDFSIECLPKDGAYEFKT